MDSAAKPMPAHALKLWLPEKRTVPIRLLHMPSPSSLVLSFAHRTVQWTVSSDKTKRPSHGTAWLSLAAFPCSLLIGTSAASNSDPYCSRAQTEILQRNAFPRQTWGKPSAWFSSSHLPSQTANAPLKPSTLLLPLATLRTYTACQDSQLPPYFILRFCLLYSEQVLPSTSNFLYIKIKGGDLCAFLCCLYYVCSEIPDQYFLINPF